MFLLELLLFNSQFPQKIPALYPWHQIFSIGMEGRILEHLAFRELIKIFSKLPVVKCFKENIGGSALGSITQNMHCKNLFTFGDSLLVVEFEHLGGKRDRVIDQRRNRVQKSRVMLEVKRSVCAYKETTNNGGWSLNGVQSEGDVARVQLQLSIGEEGGCRNIMTNVTIKWSPVVLHSVNIV